MAYFLLGNVNKHGLFQTFSAQSILAVSSFPGMKNGNRDKIF